MGDSTSGRDNATDLVTNFTETVPPKSPPAKDLFNNHVVWFKLIAGFTVVYLGALIAIGDWPSFSRRGILDFLLAPFSIGHLLNLLPIIFSLTFFVCLPHLMRVQIRQLVQSHVWPQLARIFFSPASMPAPMMDSIMRLVSWRGAVVTLIAASSATLFAAVQRISGAASVQDGLIRGPIVFSIIIFLVSVMILLGLTLNFQHWGLTRIRFSVFATIFLLFGSASYTTILPISADPCASATLHGTPRPAPLDPNRGYPAEVVDLSGDFTRVDGWKLYMFIFDYSNVYFWNRHEIIPDEYLAEQTGWKPRFSPTIDIRNGHQILLVAIKDGSSASVLTAYWDQVSGRLESGEWVDTLPASTPFPESRPIAAPFPIEDESLKICKEIVLPPRPALATPHPMATSALKNPRGWNARSYARPLKSDSTAWPVVPAPCQSGRLCVRWVLSTSPTLIQADH